MSLSKRAFACVALALAVSQPALAAKPSKKDITNCAAMDVQTAIAGCTAIFDKSPKNPAARASALYNRGLAYFRMGDYQKALADHDRAIGLVTEKAVNNRDLAYNLYLNRGRTKYQLRDWRGSAKDSEEAAKVDPTNPMAFTNWAYALFQLEEFPEAKRQLDWAWR